MVNAFYASREFLNQTLYFWVSLHFWVSWNYSTDSMKNAFPIWIFKETTGTTKTVKLCPVVGVPTLTDNALCWCALAHNINSSLWMHILTLHMRWGVVRGILISRDELGNAHIFFKLGIPFEILYWVTPRCIIYSSNTRANIDEVLRSSITLASDGS